MTVFDLVVTLLIANAVQNTMVGADFSLQGGILVAFALLVINRGSPSCASGPRGGVG
jgi:uncharacterized membrane protein YcaP (DUF421 family)